MIELASTEFRRRKYTRVVMDRVDIKCDEEEIIMWDRENVSKNRQRKNYYLLTPKTRKRINN